MKKNKIFIATGTLALAIAGFFTTKANTKKFAAATSAYYLRGSSVITLFKGVSAATFTNWTTQSNGRTAQIATGTNGTLVKIFANRTGTTPFVANTVFVRQ